MLDPRVDCLAEVLIRHSLKLRPGDKVLLESYDAPAEVVAHLVRRISEAGAVPLVETRQNRVLRALYAAATEAQMRLIGELELSRMQRMDAYIGLRGAENATELSDVPAEKMRLYAAHWWKPVHSEQRCTHTRWVVLRYPTPAMAQAAGTSLEAFEQFYFDVCTLDYGRMTAAMEPLRERMEAARQVRIVGPGTDLRFSMRVFP
jgi:aminopeptidase